MIQRLFETQRLLMWAGIASLFFVVVTALLTQLDSTEILGVSRWLKPMKFFISMAIFFWTMAIYLDQLPISKTQDRILSWSLILILALEIVIISGQSLRERRSHYNIETPIDGFLFSIMGTAIAVLTLIVIYIAYLYFTSQIELPRSVVFGLRAGLLLFILSCFQGAFMAQHMSHAVGAADGGAGMPIVNWSIAAGDLRVAHFFGMHGLQAIPIAALLFEKLLPRYAFRATAGFALAYLIVFMGVFFQALLGQPLFRF